MRERRFPRKTQERVGRKQEGAERGLRAAQPHEGASEPAVDTCCLSPVWNTGCLCGNEYCRLAAGVNRTPRAALSTRFYNRALEVLLLKISASQDPVFWLAGFTPPELYAASELRLLRRRGFSLAPLD